MGNLDNNYLTAICKIRRIDAGSNGFESFHICQLLNKLNPEELTGDVLSNQQRLVKLAKRRFVFGPAYITCPSKYIALHDALENCNHIDVSMPDLYGEVSV